MGCNSPADEFVGLHERNLMKANEIRRHFQAVDNWVDWNATTDGFHFGDPEIDLKGEMTCST